MFMNKPVSVPKGGIIFCRTTLAVLMWCALIFKIREMVFIPLVILVISAIVKIQKAPLVMIYRVWLGRFWKTPDEIVDENGMCFAHGLGAFLHMMALYFLYYGNPRVGWIIFFAVTVSKTIGAMGFCTGYKLYECMSKGGGCCNFFGSSK